MAFDKIILIVDFDENTLQSTQAILKEQGYGIITSTNGLDALDKFEQDKPDLVVLSVMLPKLHGFHVCKTIKKRVSSKTVPVIITSGIYKSAHYKYQAISKFQADAFLEKPLNNEKFLSTVSSLLLTGKVEKEHDRKRIQDQLVNKISEKKTNKNKNVGIENMLEKTLASLIDFEDLDSPSRSENSLDGNLSDARLEDTLIGLMQINEDNTNDSMSDLSKFSIKKNVNEKSSSSRSKALPRTKSIKITNDPDPSSHEKRETSAPENRVKSTQKNSTHGKKNRNNLLGQINEDEIDKIVEDALFIEENEDEEKGDKKVRAVTDRIDVSKLRELEADKTNTEDNEDSETDKIRIDDIIISPLDNKPSIKIVDEIAETENLNMDDKYFEDFQKTIKLTPAAPEDLEENNSVKDVQTQTRSQTDDVHTTDDFLDLVNETLQKKGSEKPEENKPNSFLEQVETDTIEIAEMRKKIPDNPDMKILKQGSDYKTEDTLGAVEESKEETVDIIPLRNSINDLQEDALIVHENSGSMPFGKYVLLEKIATGGMAEIFRAKQKGLRGFEKLVVIKRILPHLTDNSEFVSMFIDEGKIAAQLTHQNIAQIYDLGDEHGYYYIAMEYVHGKDLKAILQKAQKLKSRPSIEQAVFIISELCAGLDYAHRKKDLNGNALTIVHRDISPQNVLISHEGEVKIIDFGIAKAAAKDHNTRAGALKGKILYMSPEQSMGKYIDKRSDIFSLGTLLYELLTLKRLFIAAKELDILKKVQLAQVIPPGKYNSDIPEKLEKIVLKALARDPSNRYQTAGEMKRDLDAFLFSRNIDEEDLNLITYLEVLFKGRDEIGKEPEPVPVHKKQYQSFAEKKQDYSAMNEEDTIAIKEKKSRPSPKAKSSESDWEDSEIRRLLEAAQDGFSFKKLLTNPILWLILFVVSFVLFYLVKP